jgi:hypothetical protein
MLRRRAQVRKFIFVAPQHKLKFSKTQLRSLRFKLQTQLLITTFISACGMVQNGKLGSCSAVVQSSPWYSRESGSNHANIRIYENITFLFLKLRLRSLHFKHFCENLRS